jgi:hypothetical protein
MTGDLVSICNRGMVFMLFTSADRLLSSQSPPQRILNYLHASGKSVGM